MSIGKLAWKNFWFKPWQALIIMLLLLVGLASMRVANELKQVSESGLQNYVSGIDMVVGAKGSPMQLILSAVFHIDNPTGNIDRAAAEDLARHPLVAESTMLSYGDAYKGYRIVGATSSIQSFFNLNVKDGTWPENSMEVVIGADLQQILGLEIGDKFESTHGLGEEGAAHEHHPFTVVGILETSSSVYDQLIFTPLNSVWDVHGGDSTQVTALLLKFRNALGKLQLPRMINAQKGMQAAVPSLELERLQKLSAGGLSIVSYISYLLILLSFLGLFANLWQRFQERKPELALMRSLGFARKKLVQLIYLEAGIFILLVFPLALLLSSISLIMIKGILPMAFAKSVNSFSLSGFDLTLLLISLLICLISASLPAFQVYRANWLKNLS